jgi:hypothetical protein
MYSSFGTKEIFFLQVRNRSCFGREEIFLGWSGEGILISLRQGIVQPEANDQKKGKLV